MKYEFKYKGNISCRSFVSSSHRKRSNSVFNRILDISNESHLFILFTSNMGRFGQTLFEVSSDLSENNIELLVLVSLPLVLFYNNYWLVNRRCLKKSQKYIQKARKESLSPKFVTSFYLKGVVTKKKESEVLKTNNNRWYATIFVNFEKVLGY